jgi:hypothetical protein
MINSQSLNIDCKLLLRCVVLIKDIIFLLFGRSQLYSALVLAAFLLFKGPHPQIMNLIKDFFLVLKHRIEFLLDSRGILDGLKGL